MKINIQKIKNRLFGSKKNEQKDEHDISVSSDRDWIISLSIFTLAVILIFFGGIYLLFYEDIDWGGKASQEKIDSIKTINRSQLRDTLLYYENKGNNFNDMLSKHLHFIDPS